jgi:predicted solute-binding protein
MGLYLLLDLGVWWYQQTELPCRWAATASEKTSARARRRT